MEPEEVVQTLLSTPEEVKRNTHNNLLVYVEDAPFVNTLANTQEEVEVKTLRELLGVVTGEAPFYTLADSLANV